MLSKYLVHPPRKGLLVLLMLLTTAVFSRCLTADFVGYDDPLSVTANPQVLTGLTLDGIRWAMTTLHASNWHPLTWFSHMLDVQLFGLHPAGHHLTSLLLHLANTLLLVQLLIQLTGDFWKSLIVGAFFALHPLRVESVVWVAERKDLLCALFMLLTIWCHCRFVAIPSWKRYLLVVCCYIGGVLAKAMIVTLPLILLLLDIWPLRRLAALPDQGQGGNWLVPGRAFGRLVMEKLPLFALSGATSVIAYVAQQEGGSISQKTFWLKAGNALAAYGIYCWKTVIPTGLAVYYPFTAVPLWQVAGWALFLALLTLVALRLRRQCPALITGWLWYLIMILPVIGLVHLGDQARADRYTYLPGVGLLIMLVWGGEYLVRQLGLPQRLLIIFPAGTTLLLALLSFRQVGFWQDSVTLFRRAVAVTENNYLAQNNLGDALIRAGDLQGSLPHFIEALRIKPDYDDALTNIGLVYGRLGERSLSLQAYRQAIAINPLHAEAHLNLGLALIGLGDMAAAREIQLTLLRINPTYAAQLGAYIK